MCRERHGRDKVSSPGGPAPGRHERANAGLEPEGQVPHRARCHCHAFPVIPAGCLICTAEPTGRSFSCQSPPWPWRMLCGDPRLTPCGASHAHNWYKTHLDIQACGSHHASYSRCPKYKGSERKQGDRTFANGRR